MCDDLLDMEFEDRVNGGIDGEDVAELESECDGDCESCAAREDCEAAGGYPDFGPSEDMDGDHTSALVSAGLGTDEDYGDFGGGEDF